VCTRFVKQVLCVREKYKQQQEHQVINIADMDLPPGNGPGCSTQHYQLPIMQPPTNYVQVFPPLNATLDQPIHIDQQCSLMHTPIQGQLALPGSPQPLDLSSPMFQAGTATLPIQHQPCTPGRTSASQVLTLTPHVHRMSSSSEDEEGSSPPKNGWQNVSSSKRRKVHSSTTHTDTIQLNNKFSVLATPTEDPPAVRSSTTPRDPTPHSPLYLYMG
jgi:hypothetical protein